MAIVLESRQSIDADRVTTLPPSADRFPTRLVLVAMVGSITLRARFITTPLSADEGGYLAVTRAWAAGKSMYGEAWVDRPQGLLVLFRLWDDLTGGSPAAIRVMAIVFGCIAVASVAYAVFAFAGRRAAGVAAILVAVASANARIEGFIANGELLAGALAAAGVAAACAYMFRGHSRWWLLVSGVLAGCALSIKQSGFDGFLAVMLCLVAGGLTRERRWQTVIRDCAVAAAGLVLVMGALVVHGVLIGFSSWWYAVAGYRLGGLNATSDADWGRFRTTSLIAAPTILPLVVAAVAGLVAWLVGSRILTRATVLLPAWVCWAVLAFMTGGLFHRHYWVTLTFPLAAAAAVAIARVNVRMLAVATCLATFPSLISTAEVIVLDRDSVAIRAHDDPRLVINERVGRWYIEHRTPGSTLYAMCASAALYTSADAIPPFPYLWLDGVQNGKDAQDQLVELFSGANPPTFVAMYQDVGVCNPSGQISVLLSRRYATRAIVDGATILVLRIGASST